MHTDRCDIQRMAAVDRAFECVVSAEPNECQTGAEAATDGALEPTAAAAVAVAVHICTSPMHDSWFAHGTDQVLALAAAGMADSASGCNRAEQSADEIDMVDVRCHSHDSGPFLDSRSYCTHSTHSHRRRSTPDCYASSASDAPLNSVDIGCEAGLPDSMVFDACKQLALVFACAAIVAARFRPSEPAPVPSVCAPLRPSAHALFALPVRASVAPRTAVVALLLAAAFAVHRTIAFARPPGPVVAGPGPVVVRPVAFVRRIPGAVSARWHAGARAAADFSLSRVRLLWYSFALESPPNCTRNRCPDTPNAVDTCTLWLCRLRRGTADIRMARADCAHNCSGPVVEWRRSAN